MPTLPRRLIEGARAAVVAAAALLPLPAVAHPHVFVEARAEIVFDAAGDIAAVRHVWRFDEAFSAYASQGFDANRDRVFSMEELQPLAQVNVESLKEYHYFTYVDIDGKQQALADPKEYFLKEEGGQLTLFYTLPLAKPIDPSGHTVRIDVYDPEYFVAVTFVPDTPMALTGDVPAGCTLEVKEPEELDPMAATQLALIPRDTRNLPENLRSITQALANSAFVRCPKRPAAVPPPPAAQDGARRTGNGPFGVAAPEAGGGAPTGIFAVISAWQSAFYSRLTDAVKAMKADGTAAFLLVALSFGYGVFHAAGPGHGKAVIAAYLVANEATARKAVGLSFLSAFLQATVAVVLVGVAAAVLNMTSLAMSEATRWVEAVSYSLVVLLGLALVWRKIVRPAAAALRPAPVRAQALSAAPVVAAPNRWVRAPARTADGARASRFRADDATHRHGPDCGCGGHAVRPDAIAGAASWRDAAVAVVSAGSRPCTGALIVLVFALSQGMFAAGVLSAYAMAVGTGITVTVLALLAVGAKGAAMRLAGGGGRAGIVVNRLVEGAAALLVLALGGALLGATLAG